MASNIFWMLWAAAAGSETPLGRAPGWGRDRVGAYSTYNLPHGIQHGAGSGEEFGVGDATGLRSGGGVVIGERSRH